MLLDNYFSNYGWKDVHQELQWLVSWSKEENCDFTDDAKLHAERLRKCISTFDLPEARKVIQAWANFMEAQDNPFGGDASDIEEHSMTM